MTLAKQPGVIWMDGEYIPWEQATVHCLTHTNHYGVGVFEGVRAYETEQGQNIFRLECHTDRLFRSAEILKMKIPYSKVEINQIQREIIEKNGLTNAYIRPMVYYGPESLGLQTTELTVHVMIAAWHWQDYWGKRENDEGLKVYVSSYMRHHPKSVSCKAKANGNYINSIMALQEAKENACDEALLLDYKGNIAEGSSANFFIVKNSKVITPTSESILEGITRDTVIKIARALNYEVIETQITLAQAKLADEAFFTGTASEISSVSHIDGNIIGTSKCGPITKQLIQAYQGRTGLKN